MAEYQAILDRWLHDFNESPLISNGRIRTEATRALFHGGRQYSAIPFSYGFKVFYAKYKNHRSPRPLKELIRYLHYIGITIRYEALLEGIEYGDLSFRTILNKAFTLVRGLAYSLDPDIEVAPCLSNNPEFLFFVRLESEFNFQPQKHQASPVLPFMLNRYIEIPANYQFDETATELFALLENTDKSIFLTGRAGTGKSTFIHHFTTSTSKKILRFSYTGLAAINIGGQTLHSFFRLPIKPMVPADTEIYIFNRKDSKRKLIREVDLIIIDEVSMLRADILEAVDYSLRMNGGDPRKLFGGKQLLLVGDIFQLPPIVDDSDPVESTLFSSVYESEYFFDSPSYKQLQPLCIEFKTIYRQHDHFFIDLLNSVRDYSCSQATIDSLNSRYKPDIIMPSNGFAVMLTSINRLAAKENKRRLRDLPGDRYCFNAIIQGDFPRDRYPAESMLELKRGAQVMLVRNDPAENGRRWVNGTIGIIESVSDRHIEVRLKNNFVYEVKKETWENLQYQWDYDRKNIFTNIKGTFEQYPLKLAWAMTIHKSQGLTFDEVVIDLGSGAFTNGQLYTALSRCTSFEGITLLRKIRQEDIIRDERLIEFHLTARQDAMPSQQMFHAKSQRKQE